MDNWDEIRTAYQVARMGTVSGAAEVLGVHHATVIRHIDAIEGRLGVKLFQRHARGYTPTEAGQDLLRVAQATEDQFNQLSGRLKGQGDEVTGELVVTSLASLSPLLVPALAEFQATHPGLIVRFLTGERLFRLEYGEAHVAIRAGSAPDQPDNVVQRFADLPVAMYASRGATWPNMAAPSTVISPGINSSAPTIPTAVSPMPSGCRPMFHRRQSPFAATAARPRMRRSSPGARHRLHGRLWEAARHPDLVQVMPPQDDWSGALWLVTHVDLHRTNQGAKFPAPPQGTVAGVVANERCKVSRPVPGSARGRRGTWRCWPFRRWWRGSFSLGTQVANEIAPAALNAARFAIAAVVIGIFAAATGKVSRAAFSAPWRYLVAGWALRRLFRADVRRVEDGQGGQRLGGFSR